MAQPDGNQAKNNIRTTSSTQLGAANLHTELRISSSPTETKTAEETVSRRETGTAANQSGEKFSSSVTKRRVDEPEKRDSSVNIKNEEATVIFSHALIYSSADHPVMHSFHGIHFSKTTLFHNTSTYFIQNCYLSQDSQIPHVLEHQNGLLAMYFRSRRLKLPRYPWSRVTRQRHPDCLKALLPTA